jgi:hypothetical protein
MEEESFQKIQLSPNSFKGTIDSFFSDLFINTGRRRFYQSWCQSTKLEKKGQDDYSLQT